MREMPDQSLPNFVQTSVPTQGNVLNNDMPQPMQTPGPGVTQTPKPKQITGEKTLCY